MDMKIVKCVILLAIIGSALSGNAQAILKESSTKVWLDSVESSADLIPNAQLFIEKLYINSSIFYNGLKPTIESGDFLVLIVKDGSENKLITSKELKNTSSLQIEEITYKKSKSYDVLYGSFARNFGIVSVKLKD